MVHFSAQFPRLRACFLDEKASPHPPSFPCHRSSLIELHASCISLSKQRYLASFETVSASLFLPEPLRDLLLPTNPPLAASMATLTLSGSQKNQFLTLSRFPSRRPAPFFDAIQVPFQEASAIFLILETLVLPLFCKLRSALSLCLRVPEPSICFCQAVEMPSGGQNPVKQGKYWFSDPFLGGGGGGAFVEPKRAVDNIPVIFKSTLSEGGPGPELSGILQGSRIQNMLPLSCRSAFLGFQNPEYASPGL